MCEVSYVLFSCLQLTKPMRTSVILCVTVIVIAKTNAQTVKHVCELSQFSSFVVITKFAVQSFANDAHVKIDGINLKYHVYGLQKHILHVCN